MQGCGPGGRPLRWTQPLHKQTKEMKLSFVLWLALATPLTLWGQDNTKQLTINQLFELVEANSKSLRAQRSSEEIARQGIQVAKSQKLPDINTSLSTSYIGNALMTNRHFGDAHGLHSPHFGNSFTLEAQQTIYAGGALNTGVRLAEIAARQASAGTKQVREQERFLAIGQYLDIAKIDNQIKVVEKNIELTQHLLDDIKARQAQGMALKNDITRYELQMQNLKLDLTKLHNSRSIFNHQLCNTLNIKDTELVPTEGLTSTRYTDATEPSWQSEAADSAPSMQIARNKIEEAQQNVKMARSKMLPKVAIVAADNFNGPITYELPPINKNINAWYIGIGINYSLSSLFKSNKQLKQAKTAVRLSNEAYDVAAEQVNNQVQQAYTDYQQSYVELETQQKKVELARQNYEVVNDRYLNQLVLVTDMLDASNVRLDAELGEADAQINVAFTYYKLLFTAGKL